MPQAAKSSPHPPTGLAIVHSNRPENLRRVVVEHLRRFPLLPLEDEIVLTESKGIGLWLEHALATDGVDDPDHSGLGISAAVKTMLPAQFLWDAYRVVLGEEALPEESDFDAHRLRWRIYGQLPQLIDGTDFGAVRNFLKVDDDPRRRFQLSEAIADLFEQYQFHRADWLADWEADDDSLRGLDGSVEPVPEDQRWQPELWRHLLATNHEKETAHRGRVHRQFVEKLAASAKGAFSGLPSRIILFGISSLPRQALEALGALANHCQVLVTIHNPCRWYWANLIEARDVYRKLSARHDRKQGVGDEPLADHVFHERANPLLAAWGRQGRDFIDLLDRMDQPGAHDGWFANPVDWFEDHAAEDSASLLQRLQQDILNLEPVPEPSNRKPIEASDRSVRFSVNYSRQREVETLHDHLLEIMRDDPDLHPRDILVMAPSIDDYVPHIHAVFGRLAARKSDGNRDRRYIPYTIGDSAEHFQSGYLRVFTSLLDLPASRLTSVEVVDLLQVSALRERFGFAEGDLGLLTRWIQGAGIRWGLNADHRERLGLGSGFSVNSWHFGLQRMLLGYAVGVGDAFNEVQPYDEVTGGDADVAARLARLVDCLQTWRVRLSEPATSDDWVERLTRLLDEFLVIGDGSDALSRYQIDQAIEGFSEATRQAGLNEALPMEIVRDVLTAALDTAGRSQRFMTGSVSFSTLVPMRAIPFKAVCLIGMNDEDFPRNKRVIDFNLMDTRPRPGDRSRRDDDRYLFLEALLSTRQSLYVSWVGRSARDNSDMPPANVVGQLRDHIDDCFTIAEAPQAADAEPGSARNLVKALTTMQPLQPFSRKYFSSEAAGPGRLLTYAREWRDAWPDPRLVEPGKWKVLPAWAPEGAINCRVLSDFLRKPIASYLRNRLQVRLSADTNTLPVEEPMALDNLERWQIKNRLIEFMLAMGPDENLETCLQRGIERLRREGHVPPGSPGDALLNHQGMKAHKTVAHYDEVAGAWWTVESPHPIRLHIQPSETEPAVEILIEDWLDGIRSNASGELARVIASASGIDQDGKGKAPRHDKLLAHWPLHLAACASGLALTTVLVSDYFRVDILPVAPEQALDWLSKLCGYWLIGMQRPLPLAAATACRFLPAHDLAAARKAFQGDGYADAPPGEVDRDRELARFFPTFDDLRQAGGEGDRFDDWAEYIYGPLFQHEEKDGIVVEVLQ